MNKLDGSSFIIMTLPYQQTKLYDGRALIISDLESFADLYSLKVGKDIISLHETQIGLTNLLSNGNILINGRFADGTNNWIASPPLPIQTRFGTNFSDKTNLEDLSTAYLTGPIGTPPFSISYCDTVFGENIPFIGGSRYEFRGFLAAHRCLGGVEIVFIDAEHNVVDSALVQVNEHEGGKDRTLWQYVNIAGTAPSNAVSMRICIRFLRHHNSVQGMNFFIFFTDLSLRVGDQNGRNFDDSSEDSWTRSIISIGSGHTNSKLFTATIDIDDINNNKSKVYIINNNTTENLLLYDLNSIKSGFNVDFEINNGRYIIIYLDYLQDFSLYCDKKRLVGLESWKNDTKTTLKLPDYLLDGEVHLFEIRDFAGITIYSIDYRFIANNMTPWHIIQEHSAPRLPSHLAPSAAARYRALQAHLQNGTEEKAQSNLKHVHDVVVQGFEFNKNFSVINFSCTKSPVVSIIIPVHNKFEVTYFCLCALLLAFNNAAYEVILVDDGSKDKTKDITEFVKGINVIRNDTALGFIGACNKGAQSAQGKFIVFLNNDTEPTVGWLDELVASFDIFDNVGLAGSKLIYPDGTLQEAGGIVWGSGNPWNYGRGQNPFEPRYSYTRQADYLSGAAVMLPMAVWNEVGGFSEEFKPAYFEDTDLAFKVRDRGYKTLYVSSSIVYHFEGVTSGTDVSGGAKRNQEINRPKFKNKWISTYRNYGREGEFPDIEKDRGIIGRVLFIDYQMPKADFDAGSYAAIQEMRMVQALGYKVSFLAQNLAYLGRHTENLQRLGIETYYAPFYTSILDVFEKHGRDYDAIYMTRYYVVSACVEIARRLAPQAKLIMNNADLHFLRELRAGISLSDRKLVEKALLVRDEELSVMRTVDIVLSYNSVEHAVIMSHNLDSTLIMHVPWVEKIATVIAPFEDRSDVAFLGGFNHHPNCEAVSFFAQKVMPALRKSASSLNFRIYGSGNLDKISSFASNDIIIEGYVDEVSEVYDHCLVFVAPLMSGAGIKGKVLGALAYGVPCVLSPLAAEGIGLRSGYDCLIVETPVEWVEAVTLLSQDKNLWNLFSQRGQDLIRSMYSFDVGVKTMKKAFNAIGLYTP